MLVWLVLGVLNDAHSTAGSMLCQTVRWLWMAGNEVEGHSLYIPVFAPTGTDENHYKKKKSVKNRMSLSWHLHLVSSEYDAQVANISWTTVLFHKSESPPGAVVRVRWSERAGQNCFCKLLMGKIRSCQCMLAGHWTFIQCLGCWCCQLSWWASG